MYILLPLFALAFAAVAPLARFLDVPRGFLLKSLTVGGKEIDYSVYIPKSYDPDRPIPLVVYLNGMGECGTDGLRPVRIGVGGAVLRDPDKWPFIVLFPQKQSRESMWIDEEPMLMAVLGKTRGEQNIDRSRIYLTGASQGGIGTWAIAANHPDLFAAIAPVCGYGSHEMALKLVKMPIWVFHGEKDTAVDVRKARQSVEWVNAAGGSCKATIYPDLGHSVWDRAYQEEKLNEWFLEHRR